MLRNDGIGGTPRLARYRSFCTSAEDPAGDATPGRPPLAKRIPGETEIDQDPRFRLAGARAVAPAPAGALDDAQHHGDDGRPRRSPELEQAIRDANATARTHIPNRTTGECHQCGGVVSPCRPFSRALTILDRWDPSSARRIRAVLQLSGLWPAGYVHDGKDESAESYGALDDA